MNQDREIAHAMRDFMQGDGQGRQPADARAGDKGDSDGGSVYKAVKHAGQQQVHRLGPVCTMMMDVDLTDVRFSSAAGQHKKHAFDSEKEQHGPAKQQPEDRPLSDLTYGFWQKVQNSCCKQYAHRKTNDIGKLALQGVLTDRKSVV